MLTLLRHPDRYKVASGIGWEVSGRREAELDAATFEQAVASVAESDVDDICFFTFGDFLDQQGTADGERKIRCVRNLAEAHRAA